MMVVLQLIPYLLLLFITWLISVTNNPRKASVLLFFLLAFFSGCRYAVGWDYWNYSRSIQNADFGLERFEWIPRQIGYLAHNLHFTQLYFILIAFLSMFFVIMALRRLSYDFPMSFYIFMTFPLFFLNSLIIDRFFCSLAIVFYFSTYLIRDKKLILFIVGLFIAFHVHIASVVGGMFVLFYFLNITNKINILLFVLSFVLNTFIIDFLIPQIASLTLFDALSSGAESFIRYANGANSSDMNKIPILFYTINVINLLFQRRIFQKRDEFLNVYISIFNVGCCLMQIFAFEQNMSSRFSAFFLLYICFIVPYYKNRVISKYIFYSLGVLLYIYALTVSASHIDFVGRRNCYLPYNLFFLS